MNQSRDTQSSRAGAHLPNHLGEFQGQVPQDLDAAAALIAHYQPNRATVIEPEQEPAWMRAQRRMTWLLWTVWIVVALLLGLAVRK